jgi:hypothetical protein
MADDDARDAELFDTEQFDDVQAALAGLSHLDPATEPSEPMPQWAWDRVLLALDNEAAARAAASHDNVTVLAPPAAPQSTERHRFRWVGGLVAASAVILAVSVGVQLTGGPATPPNVVAGAAPQSAPSSLTKLAAPAAPTAQQDAAQAFTTPESAAAGSAAVEQPAKMVLQSDTQYTQAGLTGQVRALLDRVGVHSAREAEQLQPQPIAMPVEDGFTTSWDRIRDCLSWLAKSPSVQAVVIDRGTFEGSEAGVIIVPADVVDPNVTPPPTATLESSLGTLDVWVVDPSCRQQVDSIMEHLPFTWQP